MILHVCAFTCFSSLGEVYTAHSLVCKACLIFPGDLAHSRRLFLSLFDGQKYRQSLQQLQVNAGSVRYCEKRGGKITRF